MFSSPRRIARLVLGSVAAVTLVVAVTPADASSLLFWRPKPSALSQAAAQAALPSAVTGPLGQVLAPGAIAHPSPPSGGGPSGNPLPLWPSHDQPDDPPPDNPPPNDPPPSGGPPTTAAPRPTTTAAPRPTTTAPRPTTTAAPRPTTTAPRPAPTTTVPPTSSNPIPPTTTAACPSFASGTMTFTPSGSPARTVHVRMDNNASTNGGPLIFAWHGRETPDRTTQDANVIFNNLIGSNEVATVTGPLRGIVVAPAMHTQGTWDNATGWATSNRDLSLMDHITACANQQGLINIERVHSVGMSWGGYQTAHLGVLRSNYLASVVVMSGGYSSSNRSELNSTPSLVQRPGNKFASLVTHGGSTDLPRFGIVEDTLRFHDYVDSKGQFTILCNHNQGHVPMPDHDSVLRFLQDHPYGTYVSPYSSGSLPSEFPAYCSK